MKVLVVGGHLAPALGFCHAIEKYAEIVYVGRQHVFEGDTGESLEKQTVSKKGIRFLPLSSGRMQRKLSKRTLPSLLKIPQGFGEALAILKKEKPDVVVGFGGYLSVPVGLAAKIRGIPLVIHEQSLDAGLANKILAPFAKKICISWESSRLYFPEKKTMLTGNPMLPFHGDTKNIPMPESKEKLPLIVVSGGSGGSHAINSAILHILPELLSIARILHVTGDAKEFGDYNVLVTKKQSLPLPQQKRYKVVKFVNPDVMNTVFAKADLVVGRSGINTIAALIMLKRKAILIPLAIGQKNEQLKNAQLMESEGLAHILLQKNLSPKALFAQVQEQLSSKQHKETKWQIPLQNMGGENLAREVISCVVSNQHEK